MRDELGNSMYPDDVCGYNEPLPGACGRMPGALVKHQGLESPLACVVECGEIPWSVRTRRIKQQGKLLQRRLQPPSPNIVNICNPAEPNQTQE